MAGDTVSLQLDSVSMYGTVDSLLQDDGSSLGSDSELNGSTISSQRADKYGFLGGTQYSSGHDSLISVDISRQREMKWLEMLSRWDKWMVRRFDKIKLRCRKGIPSSLRASAWQRLSHSKQLMEENPGKFEELDGQPGDPRWLDIIEKDLHRQFPFHEMFALRGGHGQQDLYRILKAYTVYRPDEGYCQAQAPVAAVLLMHMPAEPAFWCLVQICEKYLPGYYSAGLEAIQLDGEIVSALLRRVCPLAYRHLQKFRIDPILYMTEWFMCIYSRTLPWASVLRVWDMFFCDGVKVIFKVGLVLLRCTLGSVEKLRECQGMYETMEKLRSIPPQYLHEDFLVNEVTSLKVTEALIDRESRTQRRRWAENRGELRHRPPARRLYGARAIGEELSRLNPPLSASGSRLSLSASLASLRRAPRPPSPTPSAARESLRPSLPSPTSSRAAFGEPATAARQDHNRQEEKERKRQEKERARQEEKERKRLEKERARQEKERARQEAKGQEWRPLRAKGSKTENGSRQAGTKSDGGTGALKDNYF